jgi:aryl-alcohol dehydrogenase-like predicted oxidoreductase
LARLQLDYVDILQCHDIEFGSLDQVLNFILFFYLGLQYPRFLTLRRF